MVFLGCRSALRMPSHSHAPQPPYLRPQAFNHLLSAKARHGAELDWGAIHLAVRDAAGLPRNKPPSA